MTQPRPGMLEVAGIHVLAWWGIRILSSQMPLLHYWEPSSTGWWLIRAGRASVAVGVVVAWALVRGVPLSRLGLGGRHFWRNAASGVVIVAALWFAVAVMRGKGVFGAHLASYPDRAVGLLTVSADVLAQQLPTFGLLQGVLGSSRWVVVVAWASFAMAHLVGANPGVVATAGIAGLAFALLRRVTGNLGAGVGAHFSYYALLVVLGWGIGGR